MVGIGTTFLDNIYQVASITNIDKESRIYLIEAGKRILPMYSESLSNKARKFLEEEMEKFLFGGGSAKPPGFQESDSE